MSDWDGPDWDDATEARYEEHLAGHRAAEEEAVALAELDAEHEQQYEAWMRARAEELAAEAQAEVDEEEVEW